MGTMPRGLAVLLTFAVLVCGHAASAATLDFETLLDLQPVSAQFAGLTFGNATALVSGAVGGTLNELDFPPVSGVTVVFDDGGPMTITFDAPVASVSGHFTYVTALTLTAFDALLAPVATATSAFGSNLALSGDPGSAPGELVQLAFAAGFTSLTIEGDLAGSSFTLDDFTFVPLEAPAATPVPGTLHLLATALGAAAWYGRRRPTKRTGSIRR